MLHKKMMYTYIGVDSHKDTHCAVLLDCFFEKLGEISFENILSQFDSFLTKVNQLKVQGTQLAFGLEDTSCFGRSLMMYLRKKEHIVKHVNSFLVANERKSVNVLRKTDALDAECAARVLLSRFDSIPFAEPNDQYWMLKNLVARRRWIVKTNVGLSNHAQAHLMNNYASYTQFFSDFTCKSSLAFFEAYPSPHLLDGVTEEDLETLFREATDNNCKRGRAKKILALVKRDGFPMSKYQDICNLSIQSALRQIKSNMAELENIDVLLDSFLDTFDERLTSMKGIDTVTAATLLAEIGDIGRFETPAKLAKYAGLAPVQYASGKSSVHFANERGNRVLNSIFFRLALNVVHVAGKNKKLVNPLFYEYYQRKLSEGKTKRQALKSVQRRLVNIIWSMLKHNREYLNPPSKYYVDNE